MNKISIIILLFLTFSCKDVKGKKEFEKPSVGQKEIISKSENIQIEQKTIIISDSEKAKNNIFDIVYRKIEDIEYFNGFDKQSGSVINNEKNEWEYAFVEMKNQNNRIIILEKIIETGKPDKNYQILDTIHINNVTEKEFISIGVCLNNGKVDSRIFAIIERTENDFNLEYYSKVKRAWKANLENKKIEKMSEIKEITCNNEGYGV